jgi:phospholipase A-2-activating protein
MLNKISSVNKTMISAGRKDAALNPGEESHLGELRSGLEASKSLPANAIPVVVKIVTQWPYGDRLAGLDLLRCIARYHTAAKYTDAAHGSLLDVAISSSLPSGETANENAAMMGARTIANLFGTADGRSLVSSNAGTALSFLERVVGVNGEAVGKQNRNVLVAVTTAAINLSVLVNKERQLAPNDRRRLLLLVGRVLSEQTDSEVLYRGLVALGTVVSTSKEEARAVSGLAGWVDEAAKKGSEDRVHAVAAECKQLLV